MNIHFIGATEGNFNRKLAVFVFKATFALGNLDLDEALRIIAKQRQSIMWNQRKQAEKRPLKTCPCCLSLPLRPVTHSWGIMHEAAWDQRNTGLQLRRRQKEIHTLTALHYKLRWIPLHHPFIASFLSRSPKVSFVCGEPSIEFESLWGWGRAQTSLLLTCIDLVISQMAIFSSDTPKVFRSDPHPL